MKLKRIVAKAAALTIAASMLAGCGGKTTESKETKSKKVTESAKSSASNDLVEELKAKYAKESDYEYEEPMYNLAEDYVFKFEDLSEKIFEIGTEECVKVFSDNQFTQYVDINIEEDYDSMSMTISPNLVFNLSDPEGSAEDDGTWGSHSKFWMVQYYDTKTGEEYEKPKVTVFTIKRELGTPTLSQSVQSDGFYALNWTAVEGADYYEVYEYRASTDFAQLQYTTEDTTCTYNDLKTAEDYENHWKETYEGTEIDTEQRWLMNAMLDMEYGYFVVAKSNDDKVSGTSNVCNVEEIAGQVPRIFSDDFKEEYEGDDVLALPAYVEVEMLDGSVGQFLISYHGAEVMLLEDHSIYIQPKIKNLPISMMPIKLRGVEWEKFQQDKDRLTEREDNLWKQSITTDKDIDVPFVPNDNPEKETTEKETEEETTEEETTEEDETEEETTEEETTEEDETEEETTEEETTEEDETEEETTEEETSEEEETKKKSKKNPEVSTELADTIYANTALSEWIAIHMLNHESTIVLDDFNEASDSEYLKDAIFEAYTQNPLIGIMDSVSYDYDTNSIEVTYQMSAEDTASMQEDSLKKAAEIADEIIKDGMSDYEKEAAINEYLCKNGSYNEEIMEYINEDGTIDEDAVKQFSASFTPYGILVENYGVCESYAEAFLLIAKEAGLEAVIETGRLENVNHEWNRVKIDDGWYTLDVTNNDNDYMPNCYFNLPDELSAEILVEDGDAFIDSYIPNYTSEGMKNEYYHVNGLYTEETDEAADMLAEQLKSGEKAAIRMDLNYGGSDIMEIVQTALGKAELEQGMYYYNAGVIAITKK